MLASVLLRRSPSVGGTLFTARTRVSKRLQCYEWICNSGGCLPLLESGWCLPVLALVRKGGGDQTGQQPPAGAFRPCCGGPAPAQSARRRRRWTARASSAARRCTSRRSCPPHASAVGFAMRALLLKPCRHRGSRAHTHASACTHMRARTYHPDIRPSLGSMQLADVLTYACARALRMGEGMRSSVRACARAFVCARAANPPHAASRGATVRTRACVRARAGVSARDPSAANLFARQAKKLPCGHIFHFDCLRSWCVRPCAA
jgi:hypothetical protein